MISVLTGTQRIPFKRMIEGVLSYNSSTNADEKIFIQAGCYNLDEVSSNIDVVDYASQELIDRYLERSEIVVTHAGTGSVVGALEKGLVVVVMPRLRKYGEHIDDHQVELAEMFESLGYVIYWHDYEDFSSILDRAKKFQPKVYESKLLEFTNYIQGVVDDYMKF